MKHLNKTKRIIKHIFPKVLLILCYIHIIALIIAGSTALSIYLFGTNKTGMYIFNILTVLCCGNVLANITKEEEKHSAH